MSLAQVEGTHCPLFSAICHCLQSRGVRMNPMYPPLHPCVRTEVEPLPECTQGNLIAVTSEVWALAQDSSQPETHKDQSISEYSCLDLRPNLWGIAPPTRLLSAQGRSWPDPAEDLARPSRHQWGTQTKPPCVWALSPHKHLVDGLRDPVSSA